MTSLAVFPLQRTMTDLTDDDLYQAPAIGTVFSNPAGPAYSAMSFSSAGAATAELLQILNVPDNFFEDYSHRNALNPTLHGDSQPLTGIDAYHDEEYLGHVDMELFGAFGHAQLPMQLYHNQQFQTLNQTLNPQLLPQLQPQYQPHYQPHFQSQLQTQPSFHYSQQHSQQQAFVEPQLIQHSSMRAGRITTLGDSDAGKQKDDDFFLFNQDIQPSQMLATKNYFNTEDTTHPSLFILNSDLDRAAAARGCVALGNIEQFMPMDEFAEDAEALSEDSDDDNCFQDDYGAEDRAMSYEHLPPMLPHTDYSLRSSVDSHSSLAAPGSRKSSMDSLASSMDSRMDNMHITRDYHQTAAEISATNPEHQCGLVNPSSGRACNRKFSRPYDLIRHQETIHASEKKIYRCVICEGRVNGGPGNGKQKTFSRNDALSRHIKVKHGLAGQAALDLINEAKENVEYVAV